MSSLADSGLLPFGTAPAALSPPCSGEVHLWSLPLSPLPLEDTVLSSEEQERHQRFRFAKDRHRYLATHVAMRTILARYLETRPEDLSILAGEWGKPALSAPHNHLEFNLSHSGDRAFLAVTTEEPVGVDLEFHKPGLALADLAENILSPRELEAFTKLNPEEQASSFYRSWTAKEAFLKALGTGLSLDPRATEVVLCNTDGTRGTVRTLDSAEPRSCQLRLLAIAPSCSAALCTALPAHTLTAYAHG